MLRAIAGGIGTGGSGGPGSAVAAETQTDLASEVESAILIELRLVAELLHRGFDIPDNLQAMRDDIRRSIPELQTSVSI